MKKDSIQKTDPHIEMVYFIVNKYFSEIPLSIKRMTMGICNEVYSIQFSDREVFLRFNSYDSYLKGSTTHIPLLKNLGVPVPDIIAFDYSKREVPYSYQILSKINGRDIDYVINELSEEEIDQITTKVSEIIDKVKTIKNNNEFGLVCGEFTDLSHTWNGRVEGRIQEIIRRGGQTGIISNEWISILDELYITYKDYFRQVKSTTYLADISSKNVMINDGIFSGIVDLDCLMQGDFLEGISRIKASWIGIHYGETYTTMLMDKQKLNYKERKIVLVYAIINHISWACENGIQFNKNTSCLIDHKQALKNRENLSILVKEYRRMDNLIK